MAESQRRTVEEVIQGMADINRSPMVISPGEAAFLIAMRQFADQGVGFGWMQQIIEWEWQYRDPLGAWGPEYFHKRINDLESLTQKVKQ